MASDFLAPVVEMQMHDNGIRVQYVRSLRTELVQPVITPRFIPTCTPELLQGLGKLARKYDCHVQSHLSESHDEMEFTAHLHPGEGSDADIFDRYGLLTDKCVMAHGVHINQDDAHLLRMRGAAVAHCPLSNVFFGDGVLATAKLVSMGNKVGLGTDVAGGYSPCMLSMIRNAVIADRSVRQGGRHSLDFLATTQKTGEDRSAAITSACAVHKANLEGMPDKMDWRHALYLATMGGAQALGIDKQVAQLRWARALTRSCWMCLEVVLTFSTPTAIMTSWRSSSTSAQSTMCPKCGWGGAVFITNLYTEASSSSSQTIVPVRDSYLCCNRHRAPAHQRLQRAQTMQLPTIAHLPTHLPIVFVRQHEQTAVCGQT